MTVVACFMINVEHLKEQSTTEIWTFQNPFKGFFSPLFFFSHFLSPRPAFLVCSPFRCPTSPFLPPLQRAGAWALALNSDPASNQSYPWALPSSQATDSSSLLPSLFPTSSSCSLFVPIFFFPPFLSPDPEWPYWLLMGCCSETTESKHSLSNRTTGPRPHCQPLPWPSALSINQ